MIKVIKVRGIPEKAKIVWFEEEKEPILMITSKAGPEVIAHEAGHIALKHYLRRRTEAPSSLEEFLDEEVSAWLWAERKRGKGLRTDWLLQVANKAMMIFAKPPKVILGELKKALDRYGYKLHGEENLLEILEVGWRDPEWWEIRERGGKYY